MTQPSLRVTARCPVRTTLELVGGKWKLIILQQLLDHRELRLSELRKLIPDISEKMLIQELKVLVDSQLVERRNYGEVPPRVGYAASAKGRNSKSLIKAMVRFAQAYEA